VTKNHASPVEAVKKHACQVEGCFTNYKNRVALLDHNRGIHNHEWDCALCNGKSFGSKRAADWHRSTVHENKWPFSCDGCQMTFANKQGLTSHQGSHKHKQKAAYAERQQQVQAAAASAAGGAS
jgi:hypothetical protein